MKFKNLEGQRFGRLTAIRHKIVDGVTYWLCKCQCGKEKWVASANLGRGTISCGCWRGELVKIINVKHGRCRGVPYDQKILYWTWLNMRRRCYNPKTQYYHRYGGRGISVCARWHNIENFYSDMLPTWKRGLSLDRIDNDGHYMPSNCRWATQKEQMLNSVFHLNKIK